ncbi:threonine dehydratase [Enhydrobacter aerosaccus]|uniref:Threonine dehydratase n=1 Tax=Enhydrobacter aerosaccus TaxID=225324 RepID=A0A1T4LTU5_9HYPH|nr:pyridoxal-phosphate dependent enzyme [Enhydrobacter aerosaccus]SJZ57874.1 threonine dehydratase [Enhydrobacter aerosaccus]
MRLDIDRIETAAAAISAVFLNTPQYVCESLSRALGCRIVLKVETLNPVRCFKGRGTEVVLARLQARGDTTSVVCASAGNLGQALAYGGRTRNFDVTVTASATANALKVEKMRMLGAKVVLVDGGIEVALQAAQEHAERTDAFLVEDSKNLDTCEGAATIGLELAALPHHLDAVLVALGAGAMATGVGYVMQCRRPGVEVVSVQPRNAPAMTLSYHAARVVDPGVPNTIADGVAGRYVIPEVLDDLRAVAHDAVLVTEESIKEGMRLLYVHAGLIVEPAAALGVAALLEAPQRYAGKTVATILCGSNVATKDFEAWIRMP